MLHEFRMNDVWMFLTRTCLLKSGMQESGKIFHALDSRPNKKEYKTTCSRTLFSATLNNDLICSARRPKAADVPPANMQCNSTSYCKHNNARMNMYSTLA